MRNIPYLNIDMKATGLKLQQEIKKSGYDVKYIQRNLQLSCPQPIYRWFKGQILPSINHLYMLSVILGVSMEELLVIRQDDRAKYYAWTMEEKFLKRMSYYQELMKQCVA